MDGGELVVVLVVLLMPVVDADDARTVAAAVEVFLVAKEVVMAVIAVEEVVDADVKSASCQPSIQPSLSTKTRLKYKKRCMCRGISLVILPLTVDW